MPKFTPGKWVAGPCANRNQKVRVVDDITGTTGKLIAEIYDQNAYLSGAKHLSPEHDEATHNAALIADAPAMYDLLLKVVDGFDGSHAQITVAVHMCRQMITRHA